MDLRQFLAKRFGDYDNVVERYQEQDPIEVEREKKEVIEALGNKNKDTIC